LSIFTADLRCRAQATVDEAVLKTLQSSTLRWLSREKAERVKKTSSAATVSGCTRPTVGLSRCLAAAREIYSHLLQNHLKTLKFGRVRRARKGSGDTF
jgi:hypothetical protein